MGSYNNAPGRWWSQEWLSWWQGVAHPVDEENAVAPPDRRPSESQVFLNPTFQNPALTSSPSNTLRSTSRSPTPTRSPRPSPLPHPESLISHTAAYVNPLSKPPGLVKPVIISELGGGKDQPQSNGGSSPYGSVRGSSGGTRRSTQGAMEPRGSKGGMAMPAGTPVPDNADYKLSDMARAISNLSRSASPRTLPPTPAPHYQEEEEPTPAKQLQAQSREAAQPAEPSRTTAEASSQSNTSKASRKPPPLSIPTDNTKAVSNQALVQDPKSSSDAAAKPPNEVRLCDKTNIMHFYRFRPVPQAGI